MGGLVYLSNYRVMFVIVFSGFSIRNPEQKDNKGLHSGPEPQFNLSLQTPLSPSENHVIMSE